MESKHISKKLRRKLRRKWKKKRFFVELKRSVALFSSITKMLIFIALIMLFGSSEKRHLLLVSKEDVSYIERLDWPLITIAVNLLVTGIFFCFIGIYGYACSSPYPLFTYAMIAIWATIFVGYLGFHVAFTRDYTDLTKQQLFANYKKHHQLKRAAHTVQQIYKCCGSPDYNYEGEPILPESCCPNSTGSCTRDEAYKDLCAIKRHNVYDTFKTGNLGIYLTILSLPLFIITLAEITLCLHMSRLFSNKQKKREKL